MADDARSRKKSDNLVFSGERDLIQPEFTLPEGLLFDHPNRHEGKEFLGKLPGDTFPLVFFDPQYRGVLEYQKYGNEGKRQKGRSSLRQMGEEEIRDFIHKIDRVLVPSGHLLLWVDKFHFCTGIHDWLINSRLEIVDLIVWNKMRMGMGYRTRRVSEYLLILQKAPKRAKGVWTLHDIRDVWDERTKSSHPHAKPPGLQEKLVRALTSPGDVVVDPAAGSFSVMDACMVSQRRFLGCDIEPVHG